MEHYDAVVIGAGQGGDPLARAWAAAGRRVALVERKAVGGTCVNTGCTPTKAMVASAHIAHQVRRAPEFGVHAEADVHVSLREVRARTQGIVQSFRQGTEKGLKSKGVDLIYGQAAFSGLKTMTVALNAGGERQIQADQVFLDVGARAAVPPIPGLSDVPFLDEAGLESLDSVPEHLLILGGGYIALEFGQMFRRFGSRVTILERAERLLSREDTDVSDSMADILREDGIEILTRTSVVRAERTSEVIVLTTQGPDRTAGTLIGTHLLVATGRVPNTNDLGLEKAGVEVDGHGFVKTNSRLETTAEGVYAIGDCKGGPQFTHISYDDFRVLCARLLDGKDITTEGRPVPYTVFTDPQLGRVGLTEREARESGRKIGVAKLPMTEVARAIETGETRGFMKAIVDTDDGQILGGAILGTEGGEVMAVVQTAMLGRLPYTALRDGVFAHPTLAESLNNLFMTLDPAPPTPMAGQTRRGP